MFADSGHEEVITVPLQPWETFFFGNSRISKRMWGWKIDLVKFDYLDYFEPTSDSKHI